jgi:hypothetical protein
MLDCPGRRRPGNTKTWTLPPGGTPNGPGQASRRRWSRTQCTYVTTHFPTPSAVETLATTNVETGPKI